MLARKRHWHHLGQGNIRGFAAVENLEALLVSTWSKEIRAEAGAPAHHLPELGAGAHRFEEHQVDDFGNVDAGIEHVDRDRNHQIATGICKLINQALGVLHLVVDQPGSLARQVGVVVIKTILNELGVLVVMGKNHRLADPIASAVVAPLVHNQL